MIEIKLENLYTRPEMVEPNSRFQRRLNTLTLPSLSTLFPELYIDPTPSHTPEETEPIKVDSTNPILTLSPLKTISDGSSNVLEKSMHSMEFNNFIHSEFNNSESFKYFNPSHFQPIKYKNESFCYIKPKRKRAGKREINILKKVFERTQFPSTETRLHLAKQLHMAPRTVQIWFQNKRQSTKTDPSIQNLSI